MEEDVEPGVWMLEKGDSVQQVGRELQKWYSRNTCAGQICVKLK